MKRTHSQIRNKNNSKKRISKNLRIQKRTLNKRNNYRKRRNYRNSYIKRNKRMTKLKKKIKKSQRRVNKHILKGGSSSAHSNLVSIILNKRSAPTFGFRFIITDDNDNDNDNDNNNNNNNNNMVVVSVVPNGVAAKANLTAGDLIVSIDGININTMFEYKIKDIVTSRGTLELQVIKNNDLAQHSLGKMYATGEEVAQNHKKAFEWYQKAADQGYAPAQHSLGNMYENGKGVAQSFDKAVKWYKMAADQRYAPAQYDLGSMY